MKRYLILLLFCVQSAGFTASFDCKKAMSSDEKTICADRTLNDLDVEMSVKYHFLRGLFAMGMAGNIGDEQREWLKARKYCGNRKACLYFHYKKRIKQLDAYYNAIEKPL